MHQAQVLKLRRVTTRIGSEKMEECGSLAHWVLDAKALGSPFHLG